MNDMFDFDDPAFVGRVRAWADERHQVDRAPSGLADAIMDRVVATPRRRVVPGFGWHTLTGYAALTAVITVGVTLGILFAQTIGPPVGRSAAPQPPPSVSPSPSASATPASSPIRLTTLSDVGIGATALGAAGNSVWAVDRSNRLSELDPASGAVVRSVDLPRSVTTLLVTVDSVWAASTQGALMRIDRTDLVVSEIPGAVGAALTDAGDAIWLGGVDEVVRIDPIALEVSVRVPVPGRGADLGIAAIGSDLWVATRTEILRLDRSSGTVTARLPGDATRLAVLDGMLYASRGAELLRIDPVAAAVTAYIEGIPARSPMTISSGRVWIAGPPGGAVGEVVGFEVSTSTIGFRGSTPRSTVALAVSTDTIWLATDEADSIYRFALP